MRHAGLAHRDRVEVLAHAHPALGVDTRPEQLTSFKGFGRQRAQVWPLEREVLTDAQAASRDAPEIVGAVSLSHQVVQFSE